MENTFCPNKTVQQGRAFQTIPLPMLSNHPNSKPSFYGVINHISVANILFKVFIVNFGNQPGQFQMPYGHRGNIPHDRVATKTPKDLQLGAVKP